MSEWRVLPGKRTGSDFRPPLHEKEEGKNFLDLPTEAGALDHLLLEAGSPGCCVSSLLCFSLYLWPPSSVFSAGSSSNGGIPCSVGARS